MSSYPGQVAPGGPYGPPLGGHRAAPPTQQMSGLSLGPAPPSSSSYSTAPQPGSVTGPSYGMPAPSTGPMAGLPPGSMFPPSSGPVGGPSYGTTAGPPSGSAVPPSSRPMMSGPSPDMVRGPSYGSMAGPIPGPPSTSVGGAYYGSVSGPAPGSVTGAPHGFMTQPPPGLVTGPPPGSVAGPQHGSVTGPPPGSVSALQLGSVAGPPHGSVTAPPPGAMAVPSYSTALAPSSGTVGGPSVSGPPPAMMAAPPPSSMVGPSPGSMAGLYPRPPASMAPSYGAPQMAPGVPPPSHFGAAPTSTPPSAVPMQPPTGGLYSSPGVPYSTPGVPMYTQTVASMAGPPPPTSNPMAMQPPAGQPLNVPGQTPGPPPTSGHIPPLHHGGAPIQNFTGPPTANFTGPPTANYPGPPTANYPGTPTANYPGTPTANYPGPPTANYPGPPTSGHPMPSNYPGPPGQMTHPPGPPGHHGPPGPHGPPGMPTAPVQQQPRTRIDPEQMPNPVVVMKLDQEQRGSTPYLTSTRGIPPPLVTTDFTAQDDGNCSPRYMRATMYTVPCSKDLLNSCRIPMGLVVQPLADVPPRENVLRLVDHGSQGPLRCNRCKAYMNPFARFIDGGRQYICPICQCSNEVSAEYFCHLDHQGRRTDTMQRPELCFGSVEYLATKDYCKEGKLPKPPAYIFMIDVSIGNIQNGLLSLLSQTILGILDHLPGSSEGESSPIQVGFVTYDSVIHFYNVKATLAQPQMMVLTDVADVFVPLVDGFLVNVAEARTVLESFLSQLPETFAANKTSQVVLEPVIRAGMEAVNAAGCNGRLFVFHSSLPTAQAPGMLKNRVDSKLLGTDKEKTLLSPVSSSYQKLAEECVKVGVSVELFLFPSSYCDTATLAHFVSTTGGELHYYKNYQTSRDGDQVLEDLKHSVSRNTAFDAVMRVRASTGLRPTGFYGAFYMSNTTDIELGNVDSDKAISVEIKHDDKLKEEDIAFFQAALLYTDVRGQRRLRVHNLALNCSSKFPEIYRSCEIDTIVNFFSKSITKASLTMSYKSIRESFTHQCAIILSCYRKNCSSQSPTGQLILPESLKLLPVYANCILKSDALLSPPVVSLDEKSWLMHSLLAMNLNLSGSFFYPKMLSLHDVDVDRKDLPPVLRCTGQKLQDSGCYVVENGFLMVLWAGQQLPADFITKVFGAASHTQLNTDMHSLPALDNLLSFRVRGILAKLQNRRQYTMRLFITKQRDKTEIIFRRMLKEDKGAGQWEGTSYIDFLCQVHRDIKEILS